jgi:thiol-disulfide isomerase/thioredoxin
MGCLRAKPVVDGLEAELGDRASFLRVDLLGAVGEQLAARYDVTATPTFLVFDRRGQLVVKRSGKVPTAELRRAIAPE